MIELPKPKGWRILIKPIEVQERTEGGLYLPEETKKAQEYLRYVGQVVAMGDLCYRHEKFRGEGDDPRHVPAPWCEVGDYVAHGQYSGQEVLVKTEDGVEKYRLVNDDEILAVITDPNTVVTRI